ncbi:MAG: 4-fold beta flower protein [Velocimicrobium sp.]
MLQPLFDKDCNFIGWIKQGEHIFNQNMDWIAYISNGHAWSAATENWMGLVNGLVCLDTSGKVVLWSTGGDIIGAARPSRPSRAARTLQPERPEQQKRPETPSRPTTPDGGWSSLSAEQWSRQ